MLKLCFVLLIATLSFSHLTHSECCTKRKVEFRTKEKICRDFGASNRVYQKGILFFNNDPKKCKIWVCGDGKQVTRGSYCGKGPCNIFGCNCDGGCIEGNAGENFRAIHGHENVYIDK